MRLEEARDGDVVQNRRNGSFYRFIRPEGSRVRIRPLELFPNGLLIEKTADTIVDADLQVDAVGRWSGDLYVEISEGQAVQQRRVCEAELATKRTELEALESEMDSIDPHKHGGRGSHANKIKSARWRVEVLERGLAERTEDINVVVQEETTAKFAHGGIVQLPSGLPALVTACEQREACAMANIRVRVGGNLIDTQAPAETLRPWQARSLATI